MAKRNGEYMELTIDELVELINSQEGEFIIEVVIGEEGADEEG